MSSHLEEGLQRDLERIRASIGQMADFAAHMLQDCVAAFEKGNRQLASLIILRDQRVDQMDRELDRYCLEFLVRHQPAGAHLRFAYSALQINFELERIGDYAESIARQVIKLIDLRCRLPVSLFAEIATSSIAMLRNAVSAFVRQDAELAEATGQIEEKIDILRNQVNSELMHLVQSNQIPLAALTPLMTIARRFERVSDQAKSICHETIYLCTGEYAKHVGTPRYHILFVDDDHGCPSRLAESIGRRLGRADVEFASAGIDPQPLTPEAVAFLESRQLSTTGSQAVRDLPDFNEYQLVIALSPGAKQHLPAPTRKTVHLDWGIADLVKGASSSDQLRESYQTAERALTHAILEVVGDLTGEQEIKL
jgi:phosphate transport system protein